MSSRLERWSNFCGNGLFFLSDAILIFLDTVTHVTIATDYLDITIVNDVF